MKQTAAGTTTPEAGSRGACGAGPAAAAVMKPAARFALQLRSRPLRTLAGLCLEYAGYVAACCFVLLLLATRLPFAWLDRIPGLRLRERCIELISRVSPG
jgi:hypothetical protein